MLLGAHSGIRYLILLAGVAVVAYSLFGVVSKRPYDERMRKLAAAFSGLIQLQLLIGLALIFTGTFYPALSGHILMMVLAAVSAQVVPSVMRRRPLEERTYLPFLVGALAAFGLIFGGVTAIQQSLL